jgi:translocation and assembly module TamB
MVKPYWKYALGGLLLMVSLAVVAGYWLLATNSGARWLSTELVRRSSLPLIVGQVEGRLCDNLRLQDVRVEWPGGSLATEFLQIVWRPTALLRGKLLISAVTVQGVVLTTVAGSAPPTEPAQPMTLSWPELPGWLKWLRVELRQLHLEAAQWQRPEQPPLVLERFTGRLRWTGKRLQLTALELVAPQGTLNATLEAGWGRPSLTLEAIAEMAELAGGEARVQLSLRIKPREAVESLQGQLKLTVVSAPTGKLTLASGVQLDAETLALTAFELAQPDLAGRVTGSAKLHYGVEAPQLELQAVLTHWDLAQLAGMASDLSGTLQWVGGLDDYHGEVDLSNNGPGWQKLQLASPFSGTLKQISFPQLQAQALAGTIGGNLAVSWQPLLDLRGSLTAKGLDLAIIQPDWPGTISLQAEGHWRQPATGPFEAALRGQLLDSTLRGYQLKGSVDGRLQGTDLELASLELQGQGVSLSAKGVLRNRLDVRFQADDLAKLLPDAAGALQGGGWLRWRDQQLAGVLRGSGSRLRYAEHRLTGAKFNFSRPAGRDESTLSLDLQGLQSSGLPSADVTLQGTGLPQKHRLAATVQVSPLSRFELAVAGGYSAGAWKGTLQRLMIKDAIGPLTLVRPAPLTLSGAAVQLQDLTLQGVGAEELQAKVDLQLQPFSGRVDADWRELNLARGNLWQKVIHATGRTSGRTALKWPVDGRREVAAKFELSGRLEQDALTVDLRQLSSQLTWNRNGLQGDAVAELAVGGRFKASFRSVEPPALTLPQRGEWQLNWQDLELQPWLADLPAGLVIEGRASGSSAGSWSPGGQMAISGQTTIAGGRLAGKTRDGLLSFVLQSATVTWDWRGEQLSAETSLVLEEYGRLDGSFGFPLPASLPLVPNPDGRLSGRLTGKMREQGLVALLLPGVIQESRGSLTVDLTAGGKWNQPVFSGRLTLAEAGAYLPAAGIELKDLGATAEVKGDRLHLSEFVVSSGAGQLRGSGFARVKNWRIAEYQAKLVGEKFQAVDLPELQAQIDPDLRIEGTPEGLHIDGRVTVNELLLRELATSSAVNVSEDVVLVNAESETSKTKVPLAVNANIDLILGKHVLVKVAGLDARLEGKMKLQVVPGKQPTGSGRISVAEGAYSAYGAKLDIERGNLLFSGGPVQDPTFDILALRTVGKVKAGVRVAGTPRAPRIELYSEPPMGNNDRLAYIVLGRPVAQTSGDADLLMTAAGALLSRGESVVLQDQLKRQLGVDVLGFEAGDDDMSTSMLTIGKYLSPDLYVSYGQSLFTETSEFRMRYSLGERWEVESKTGTESGVDLYYKIEFR